MGETVLRFCGRSDDDHAPVERGVKMLEQLMWLPVALIVFFGPPALLVWVMHLAKKRKP